MLSIKPATIKVIIQSSNSYNPEKCMVEKTPEDGFGFGLHYPDKLMNCQVTTGRTLRLPGPGVAMCLPRRILCLHLLVRCTALGLPGAGPRKPKPLWLLSSPAFSR